MIWGVYFRGPRFSETPILSAPLLGGYLRGLEFRVRV